MFLAERPVNAIDPTHSILEIEFEGQQFSAAGSDFFESLLRVRLLLEPHNLMIRVYGATRNVWPSGMARDMGRGLKAYPLTMCTLASSQGLVDIFSTSPAIVPVSVEEQRECHRQWLQSLRLGE